MRRLPLLTTAVAAAISLGMNVAAASPPTGQIDFVDHGRAQVAQGGDVHTPEGSHAFMASYDLDQDAGTGWRDLPGATILSVTAGTATLHSADGCTAEEVPVGKAVVVPTGAMALQNHGSGPVEVLAGFFGLADGVDPWAGPAAAAPSGCPDLSTGSGASAGELGHGKFLPASAYKGHAMEVKDVNTVEEGGDVLVTTYTLAPGASSGWITHRGQFGVVTAGTLTYYEEHANTCVKTDSYTVGDAFVHVPHQHMAVNEGKEPTTVTIYHYNLPHNEHPAPVVGNQGDALDFTPTPPPGCPRVN